MNETPPTHHAPRAIRKYLGGPDAIISALMVNVFPASLNSGPEKYEAGSLPRRGNSGLGYPTRLGFPAIGIIELNLRGGPSF